MMRQSLNFVSSFTVSPFEYHPWFNYSAFKLVNPATCCLCASLVRSTLNACGFHWTLCLSRGEIRGFGLNSKCGFFVW